MPSRISSPTATALPISLLAAAGFLTSAGARVIDPLLAVIADDFATTIPAVSIVVAAYTLPYGLCQIGIGPLGDRIGKLRVVLWAMAAFAVATAACALAGGVATLALLRVAAGAASAAVIPLSMAYIADAVPYSERQVTISRFLNGVVLASLLAGPVGGIFGEFIGWRGMFLALAALGALVAIAMRRRIARLPDRSGTAAFSLANYLVLARQGPARRLLLCGVLNGTLLMGSFPFLAPYMHEAFGLPHWRVGLVLAAFGVGALAYTRTVRRIIPVLGEPGCVLLGGALMAAALTAGMFAPSWWLLIPVEVVMGFGFYSLHGVMQARATELLPQARATAVSSFAFTLFLGQSLGALLIATLIAWLGYVGAFLIDAAAIAVFTVYLRGLVRRPTGA